MTRKFISLFPLILIPLSLCFIPRLTQAQGSKEIPREWIDPDTGHRVIRLSDEPGSASLYFHQNGYTPDGEKLVITTPTGLAAVNLKTHTLEKIVEEMTLQEGVLEQMVPLAEVVPILFLFLHPDQGAVPIRIETSALLIENPIVLPPAHVDLMNGMQDREQRRDDVPKQQAGCGHGLPRDQDGRDDREAHHQHRIG